ncbi:endonuclease III domain-containing protein, partial [Thermococci archaeon]
MLFAEVLPRFYNNCVKMEKNIFSEIFYRLYKAYGPQHWWPGDSPLEIAIGAILTQNTNWMNVEKAIGNLKKKNLMDAKKLLAIQNESLADLIKPAGYYRIKAERLKNFLRWLVMEGGFEGLKSKDIEELRDELLKIKGIGKETADSILLYAIEKPIFVIDAYTRRILKRMGIIQKENMEYDELRNLFESNLPRDVE